MTTSPRRLANAVWLGVQIPQGMAILVPPVWQALSSLIKTEDSPVHPSTFGALMLLIAASCLIPVAVETLSASNRILKVGTAAAALFGFFGALGALAALSENLAILWSTFNLYPLVIILAVIFIGHYASGAIRHRVTLHSQVTLKSQLSKSVARSRSSAHHWSCITHFIQAPPRTPPTWSRVTHFFIDSDGDPS